MSVTIENRKARYDYYIEERIECGIALRGNEVKSIREGTANITEAWCDIRNGNLMVHQMRISKWSTANDFDIDEMRDRQLLAHKSQIRDFEKKVMQDGYTLVPLKVYFVKGKVKIEVGLCKGKHTYDKRNTLKERQSKRDIERALKGSR